MTIKRIEPPKFFIKEQTLNEFELRFLMYEVSLGLNNDFIGAVVTDEQGNSSVIRNDGVLTNDLKGMDLSTRLAISLFKGIKIESSDKAFEYIMNL
jgi:hypothetical protein